MRLTLDARQLGELIIGRRAVVKRGGAIFEVRLGESAEGLRRQLATAAANPPDPPEAPPDPPQAREFLPNRFTRRTP